MHTSFWRTQTNVSSSSYTLSFLSSSLWLKHTDTQQHKNKNNFKTRGDDSFPTERVFAKDELAPDGPHVAIHQHKREPQEQSDAAEPGRTSRTDNSDSDSHILHTTCAQLDLKKNKTITCCLRVFGVYHNQGRALTVWKRAWPTRGSQSTHDATRTGANCRATSYDESETNLPSTPVCAC